MKHLLIVILIALASCNKNKTDQEVPIVFPKDSVILSIQNNLSTDVTNVITGWIDWDWYDDSQTKAFLLNDIGQIEKESAKTTQVKNGPDLVLWFDIHSSTYMVVIAVNGGKDTTYLLTDERKLLWEQVAKTGNRYPH